MLQVSQEMLPYLRSHGVTARWTDVMMVRTPARIVGGASLRCEIGAQDFQALQRKSSATDAGYTPWTLFWVAVSL